MLGQSEKIYRNLNLTKNVIDQCQSTMEKVHGEGCGTIYSNILKAENFKLKKHHSFEIKKKWQCECGNRWE